MSVHNENCVEADKAFADVDATGDRVTLHAKSDPEPVGSVDVGDVKVEVSNGGVAVEAGKLADAEGYWTCDRSSAVKIRFSKEGPGSVPAKTVMETFEDSIKRYGKRKALSVEREGQWISWTYEEYLDTVRKTAKAFIKLGLEPFHAVGVLGFNAPEWLFADIGAIYAGGFACGVYTTNNPEACQYVAADAACNILVVENDAQLQKILQVWDNLPDLKCIVQYTGELKSKRENVYTWTELMEIGGKEDEMALNERILGQSANNCCTLIYTSGTTGNPKGVMLSHDNIVVTSNVLKSLLFDDKIVNRMVSYLPLSHIAAQIADIFGPLVSGTHVFFAKPDALKGTLVETLKHVRPTVFLGVPRVWEKFEEKMKSIGASVTGFKKTVSTWAKGVGLQGNKNKLAGKSVPFGWKLAHILVLNKVKLALGLDQARLLYTAAAPISLQTLEYFLSLDIPLLELYGMSETTGPLTINTPESQKLKSIGKVFHLNEARVDQKNEAGDGELCFRGRNVFMGYLNNNEKVKETIDEDGWIHTGDIGREDENGFFYITGRIKEIIITAGGENIAPVPIEDRIKEQLPFVANAMVIGDKRKFLSVLLTPQVEIDLDTGAPKDNLVNAAKVSLKSMCGLDVMLASEISPDVPEVLSRKINEALEIVNKKAVSNAAKVQKWKLLPLDFTTASEELGPTQKLRRPIVSKKYADTIDEFYA